MALLEEEDKWFAAQLSGLPVSAISPCCNIGSGIIDPAHRPYLHRLLDERDVPTINFDRKSGPGIHISGDIFREDDNRKLKDMRPRLIMCNNVIEHIPRMSLAALAQILNECLADGGYLFISAPRSHPYHLDPIDNMYRPKPAELASLFPRMAVLAQAIVLGPTYWEELKRSNWSYYWRVARRLLKPFRKRERWKATVHRFGWLWSRYEQTCLVLHKRKLRQPDPG